MGQGFESLQARQALAGISFRLCPQREDLVDIAQLVRVPGCGPGGRRFESDYPPHFPRTHARLFALRIFITGYILGCSQGVRQRTLTPSSAGSNPAIPAKKEVTFVYQKLLLFLSKPQAWHIITRRRVYHRRRRISSAEGCITCGLMRCNTEC